MPTPEHANLNGPPIERLAGLVERVTFHSEETGFCVLKVQVKGFKDLVPVLGAAPTVSPGEYVTATGIWVNDRDHGRQFKAEWLKVTPPTSVEGIEKYLGSGMVKGIGPVNAKRMVEAFGEEIFNIIEQQPIRLLEVSGIGKIRMSRITGNWESQKVIKTIMVFLHSNGVSTSKAVRIYKTYGAPAVELVTEDPYRLARDIRGIGFRSADKIAEKLGWPHDSEKRIRAGITFALMEASSQGHCGLPRKDLIKSAVELLGVDAPLTENAITSEKAEKLLIEETEDEVPILYVPALHATESSIARHVMRLISAPRTIAHFDAPSLFETVHASMATTLSLEQETAVLRAASSKVMVITGGPGTGKTTIVDAILKVYETAGAKLLLCAPTGKAAKRMSETTAKNAVTIHRLLGFKPGGGAKFDESNPLDCDLLLVDESSMVDVYLMNSLLKALPDGATLLLVGDTDQLPSVGPGEVLADLIASKVVGTAVLTKIFRQAAGSHIIQAAHAINRGSLPLPAKKGDPCDFYFLEEDDPEKVCALVVDLVKRRLPAKYAFDPVRDIQVVCPMNKTSTGARNLNSLLQTALNANTECVERFGTKFIVGDKVMQTANDYNKEIYNGDVGLIKAITAEDVVINFGGRDVSYDPGELDHVQLAYAATVHKLQGSQAPCIVMTLTTQHYALLQRNLVYTGITRGQQLVVVVGQRKALAMAVRNVNKVPRHTRLCRTLKELASRQPAGDAQCPDGTHTGQGLSEMLWPVETMH